MSSHKSMTKNHTKSNQETRAELWLWLLNLQFVGDYETETQAVT